MDNSFGYQNGDIKSKNSIEFKISNTKEPIILLKDNGDIFVKGNLIENDIEVVNALREFLRDTNYLK
jgi:hypothetical protein